MRKRTYFSIAIILILTTSLLIYPLLINNGNEDGKYKIIQNLTPDELAFLDSIKEDEITIGLSEGNKSAEFLINELKEVFDLDIESIVYRDFGNLLQDAMSGDIDVATYISYKEERTRYLDFSEPIGLENVYLFTKKPISESDIHGKTILVSRGSIFEDYLVNNFANVNVEYYLNLDDGLSRLQDDDVFGFVGSDRSYEKALSYGYRTLNLKNYIPISPVYLASRKNEGKELLALFSKLTSSREYSKKLYEFEYQVKRELDIAALQTLIDNSSLDKDKVYKVMLEVDDPYVFYKNGKMVGYTKDIVDEVFSLLNLEYEIANDESTSWNEMYNGLLDNQIDVLGSIVISEERKQFINFSNPIWESNYYVIQKDGLDIRYTNIVDLQSQNIGVVNNDFRHSYLMKVFPRKQFSLYNDAKSLMDAFLDGEVDYIILSEVQHTNFVYKTKRTDIERNTDIGAVLMSEVALGFQKNTEGQELAQLFSSAYELIDFNELKGEYFEGISLEAYYEQERLYLGLLIVAVVLAAGIIVLVSRKKLRGDWPTGTLNRYAFKSDFKSGISKNKTFIFIDINKLKQLNDVYGHLVVDKILLEYCQRISSSKYNVYRVGGDEFVIVDTFKNKDAIYEFAKFLSSQHIVLEEGGIDLVLTASIGVIERVGDVMVDESFNQRSYLLSLADYTMYRAKKDANLSIKYCNYNDVASHLLKVEIENIANKPIDEVGIYPVFQPIVNYKSKEVIGFEALARWQNGEKAYMPDDFIPVFENMNKISELDIFIFDKAIAMIDEFISKYPEQKNVYVSSNFSVKSLGFLKVEDFIEVFEKYNVSKDSILIEITESTFFDTNCYKLIAALKENGFRVAIDDFSSGHSTINSIVALDVDVVKIDKYIVENISKKMVTDSDYSKELLILEAITKLIKSIESDVIVEGIESSMIDKIIASADIDFVQGNYYSLPLHQDKILEKKY